jgi:hypothetical protein
MRRPAPVGPIGTVARALWRWSSALLRVSMQVGLHEPIHDTGGYLIPHGQPMQHGFTYISAVPGRKWFTRTLLLLMGLVLWVPAAVLGLLALIAYLLSFLLDLPFTLAGAWLGRSDSIVPDESQR